jgi:hypothetical protein
MKTIIFIIAIFMNFFCFRQSGAYQINILEENYLCKASATVHSDISAFTNSGIYYASASESYYYIGMAWPAEANATATLVKNYNPVNLAFTAAISGMNQPYGEANCGSSVTGEVYFSVSRQSQDLTHFATANFHLIYYIGSSGRMLDSPPGLGIYLNDAEIMQNRSFIDFDPNLCAAFVSEYSFEVNVNEIQKLTFSMGAADHGSMNPDWYKVHAEINLSVPTSDPPPVSIPGAYSLLLTGLGCLAIYWHCNLKVKNSQSNHKLNN